MDIRPLRIIEEQPSFIKIREISLETFLRLTIRHKESVGRDDFEEITADTWNGLCQLIAGIDKERVLCYVQFPEADNELKYPRLWPIAAWKESHAKHLLLKKQSEERRRVMEDLAAKIEELTRAIERDTGLELELASMVAKGIMHTQDVALKATKAKQFGVII